MADELGGMLAAIIDGTATEADRQLAAPARVRRWRNWQATRLDIPDLPLSPPEL